MITFFESPGGIVYAVKAAKPADIQTINKLSWLFGDARPLENGTVSGTFIGPRKEMITPWSTNAVEITQNMAICCIERIELFRKSRNGKEHYDAMLEAMYENLDQELFTIGHIPEEIHTIRNLRDYNHKEGLALSEEEVSYLEALSHKIGRKLTDSEIFGFSQVNSEHCRHKIFNGTFVIDGIKKESTLFQLIRQTTKSHPNRVVSAYKDNCAFLRGPEVLQFAP